MHLSEGPLIDGPIMQERSKFRYSIFSSSKIRTQDARVESVNATSAVQAHLKLTQKVWQQPLGKMPPRALGSNVFIS